MHCCVDYKKSNSEIVCKIILNSTVRNCHKFKYIVR